MTPTDKIARRFFAEEIEDALDTLRKAWKNGRELLGLTQKEMAASLGLTVHGYKQLEWMMRDGWTKKFHRLLRILKG